MNTVVLKGGEKDQVSKDPATLIKCDGTPAKPIWFPARIFTEYGRANFGEEDKGKMLNELCNAQVTCEMASSVCCLYVLTTLYSINL